MDGVAVVNSVRDGGGDDPSGIVRLLSRLDSCLSVLDTRTFIEL